MIKLSIRALSFLLILVIALISEGCGGGGDDYQPSETLAKTVENIQCELPRTTLKQLDDEALAAGLELRSKACAWDGLASVATCGTPSNYLRVIEIPRNQVELARKLGYLAPTEFYMFIPGACPQQ
jgi:hypothetical protein